jgi:hypothetical protein
MTTARTADPFTLTLDPDSTLIPPLASQARLGVAEAGSMISPWPDYCGGAAAPMGAHVLTFVAGAASVKGNSGEELDGITAFDEAERKAGTGGINVSPVSSFCGTEDYARIWGLDFARHPDLDDPAKSRALFLMGHTPVFSLEPLVQAGRTLLGPSDPAVGHFPVKPGAFVHCAQAKLEVPATARAAQVWAGIAIGIPMAEERAIRPCLMMEGTGHSGPGRSQFGRVKPGDDPRRHALARSVAAIGQRRGVAYEAILVGLVEEIAPADYTAGAWFAAKYLTLPEQAVPNGDTNALASLALPEWEGATRGHWQRWAEVKA